MKQEYDFWELKVRRKRSKEFAGYLNKMLDEKILVNATKK